MGLLIVTAIIDILLPFAMQLQPVIDAHSVLLLIGAHNAVSGVLWGVGLALVIVAVSIGRGGITPAPGQPSPPSGPLP